MNYILSVSLEDLEKIKNHYSSDLVAPPTEYVYFNPVQCRFYFRSEQERTDKDVVRQLVKRYSVNEPYNAVEIVATKYPFSKLILGAVVYRKIISYREFFNLVREKPELF